jgi:hypothetical protein
MATNSLQLNTSSPVAGLGTSTYNVALAGMYSVNVQSTLPFEQGTFNNSSVVPPVTSGLQIVINQNGSPMVTVGGSATNPTPTQPSMGASAKLQCAASDVITVVLSSANAIDNQPNSVKSTINLYQGE